MSNDDKSISIFYIKAQVIKCMNGFDTGRYNR